MSLKTETAGAYHASRIPRNAQVKGTRGHLSRILQPLISQFKFSGAHGEDNPLGVAS